MNEAASGIQTDRPNLSLTLSLSLSIESQNYPKHFSKTTPPTPTGDHTNGATPATGERCGNNNNNNIRLKATKPRPPPLKHDHVNRNATTTKKNAAAAGGQYPTHHHASPTAPPRQIHGGGGRVAEPCRASVPVSAKVAAVAAAVAAAPRPTLPLPGCCPRAETFARGSGKRESSSGDDTTEEPMLVTRLERGAPAPAELGIARGEAATAAAAAAAVAVAVAEEGVVELAGEHEVELCLGVPWVAATVAFCRPGVPSLLAGLITRDSQPGDTCSHCRERRRDLRRDRLLDHTPEKG